MTALRVWRRRHFLLVDVVLAIAVASIAIEMADAFLGTSRIVSLLDGIRTTLYGTASAGCAALLGFVITTATITDAVMQNSQWEEFRKSFAYAQVQDIYFGTIRWLGLSTLLFLLFLVADTDAHPQLLCEVASTWLLCIIAIRMYRSIDALETLLRMNSFKQKLTLR